MPEVQAPRGISVDALKDGYVPFTTTVTVENGQTATLNNDDPDGDGLSNLEEQTYGTDPLSADTDDDGLVGEEWNNLVGDWASHPYYALGWIASGIAVYGDVRDFIYAVSEHDTVGAAISAFGLAPYLGDCSKTAADITKYLVKYPDNLLEIGRLLVDQHVIQLLPDEGQLNVIDHLYLFATGRKVGTELKAAYDLTDAQMEKMVERTIELDKVVKVAMAGEDAVPFTSDKFAHAVGRHVDGTEGVGDPTTLFPTSESVTSFGIPYPGTSSLTREQMKAKILDWVGEALSSKLTTGWPMQKRPVQFTFPDERHDVRVIEVGVDKSGIYTVFPLEGEQVYKWYNGQWNHMPYTGRFD